jgi:hypothetical protein
MDTRLEFRPIQTDLDSMNQRSRRAGIFRNSTGPPPERRSTISSMTPSGNFQPSSTRMRNLSGGSSGSTASGSSTGSSLNLDNQYSDNHFSFGNVEGSPFGSNSAISQGRSGSSMSHRKLDRSLSDSDSDRLSNNGSSSSHRSVNSSRYKTELCRPFEESGSCKYGDKCQFAHGYHELRNLARHPKYKTELCRTFHTIGFCPYGPRCHFVHEDDGKTEPSPKLARQASSRASSNYSPNPANSGSSSPSLSPSSSDNDYATFTYQADSNAHIVPGKVDDFPALSVNINTIGSNSNNNLDLQSLEHQFSSALNFSRNSANDNASNVFGGVFNSNKKDSRPIGSEKPDIFSEVTMFNSAEVTLDNAPKPSSSFSQFSLQSNLKLDNSPFVASSLYWQSCESAFSQSRPVDVFHHSPTGSMGSDGNGSDCSGSTESLASSGCCREHHGSLSPYSNWISGF